MNTISNVTDHAAEHMKAATSHTRGALLDLSVQVIKLLNSARAAEGRGVSSVLGWAGLRRRQSWIASASMPAVGFVAGAAVAGGVVFLVASEPGKKLRQRIARFIDVELDALSTDAQKLEERVEETMKNAAGPVVKAVSPNGSKHEA